MSANVMRTDVRNTRPAFPDEDRKISQTALQSLRDYRRERVAGRSMPSQPKAAA